MTTTLRLVATLGFLIVAAPTIHPDSAVAQSLPEQAVIAVIEAFHQALAAGDSVAALSHLADGVVVLESGGIEDRAAYRAGHLAADMAFAAALPRTLGEMEVTLMGEVAWAASTSIVQGEMDGRALNAQAAELMVLVRESGAWKIHAIHWSSRRRTESD